jgi:hypothetical protein
MPDKLRQPPADPPADVPEADALDFLESAQDSLACSLRCPRTDRAGTPLDPARLPADYQLKRPLADGRTELVLQPTEFLHVLNCESCGGPLSRDVPLFIGQAISRGRSHRRPASGVGHLRAAAASHRVNKRRIWVR